MIMNFAEVRLTGTSVMAAGFLSCWAETFHYSSKYILQSEKSWQQTSNVSCWLVSLHICTEWTHYVDKERVCVCV